MKAKNNCSTLSLIIFLSLSLFFLPAKASADLFLPLKLLVVTKNLIKGGAALEQGFSKNTKDYLPDYYKQHLIQSAKAKGIEITFKEPMDPYKIGEKGIALPYITTYNGKKTVIICVGLYNSYTGGYDMKKWIFYYYEDYQQKNVEQIEEYITKTHPTVFSRATLYFQPTPSFSPVPEISTKDSVIASWGQPTETIKTKCESVKIISYDRGDKIHVLMFLQANKDRSVLKKIVTVDRMNYDRLKNDIAEISNFALVFNDNP